MSDVKCPNCGSNNVSRTAIGYGEKLLGGTLALAGGLLVGMFNQHMGHHLAKEGAEKTPSQYHCKRCGLTFHK